MNFPLSHIASLCKYTGISFTAGAITHGFFSEERSLLTAAFGIAIYLIGGVLEKWANPDKPHSWFNLLAIGIVASIGLGFFTGGLQHFPDSPSRSAWVVPVGFAMSLFAMYWIEAHGKTKTGTVWAYAVLGILVVTGASIATWLYLSGHAASSHGHDHDTSSSVPRGKAREVRIEMDDSLRFTPSTWEATQGEALRIIVVNKGKQTHEVVIGREVDLKQHIEDAKKPNFKDHPHDNEVSVKPGQQGELLWTFKESGPWAIGCLEDGHFEAGLRGQVLVAAKP